MTSYSTWVYKQRKAKKVIVDKLRANPFYNNQSTLALTKDLTKSTISEAFTEYNDLLENYKFCLLIEISALEKLASSKKTCSAEGVKLMRTRAKLIDDLYELKRKMGVKS